MDHAWVKKEEEGEVEGEAEAEEGEAVRKREVVLEREAKR
jgi:hypothetical protein